MFFGDLLRGRPGNLPIAIYLTATVAFALFITFGADHYFYNYDYYYVWTLIPLSIAVAELLKHSRLPELRWNAIALYLAILIAICLLIAANLELHRTPTSSGK